MTKCVDCERGIPDSVEPEWCVDCERDLCYKCWIQGGMLCKKCRDNEAQADQDDLEEQEDD
ncbi:hypothetical protein LCGC14_1414620 [marine sediment metagenome]|uniref:Uncharacterized protein n=1 Tax=marine sediment metagenome TaxID=412755 RepID=A0A0F9JTK0_9ZZZZ